MMKNDNFQMKNHDIINIYAQNKDCGHLLPFKELIHSVYISRLAFTFVILCLFHWCCQMHFLLIRSIR